MEEKIFDSMNEFAKLAQRASEFGREVLRENHELKQRLRQIPQASGQRGDDGLASTLIPDGTAPDCGACAVHREQLEQLRAENNDLTDEFVQLEQENTNLVNFYVASQQLHSTLVTGEVLRTIQEIVINLIGAECFAIYLQEKTGELHPILVEGIGLPELQQLSAEDGGLGSSLASGLVYVAEPGQKGSLEEPLAAVPLAFEGQMLGAIVIYALLDQKDGFNTLDHGLFALLAQHAGTALLAAQLFTKSERARETMESAVRMLIEAPKE